MVGLKHRVLSYDFQWTEYHKASCFDLARYRVLSFGTDRVMKYVNRAMEIAGSCFERGFVVLWALVSRRKSLYPVLFSNELVSGGATFSRER